MLSGNLDSIPTGTVARWQLAVDTTYRLIQCDLIAVDDLSEAFDEQIFMQTIRTSSPYNDGAGYWHATLIWGTDRLSKLIDAHLSVDAPEEKPTHPLIDTVVQLFAENGVPWSDRPLLPIEPASAEAAARNRSE